MERRCLDSLRALYEEKNYLLSEFSTYLENAIKFSSQASNRLISLDYYQYTFEELMIKLKVFLEESEGLKNDVKFQVLIFDFNRTNNNIFNELLENQKYRLIDKHSYTKEDGEIIQVSEIGENSKKFCSPLYINYTSELLNRNIYHINILDHPGIRGQDILIVAEVSLPDESEAREYYFKCSPNNSKFTQNKEIYTIIKESESEKLDFKTLNLIPSLLREKLYSQNIFEIENEGWHTLEYIRKNMPEKSNKIVPVCIIKEEEKQLSPLNRLENKLHIC